MMFRSFGKVEMCFVFALLITNALSCCFDTIVENILWWKRNYISSFEKNKSRAQQGGIKLTDTQEIELPKKYRYNTPPIDGKIKRRRPIAAPITDEPDEDGSDSKEGSDE